MSGLTLSASFTSFMDDCTWMIGHISVHKNDTLGYTHCRLPRGCVHQHAILSAVNKHALILD